MKISWSWHNSEIREMLNERGEWTGYDVRLCFSDDEKPVNYNAVWDDPQVHAYKPKILCSFNTLSEAEAYCEVLYRMGVNHE